MTPKTKPEAAAIGGPASSAPDFEPQLAALLPAAYGTALRLTGNSADAEDLVQETALLAFRGFGSFEPGTNFKAWFFKILTNAFHGRWRKTRREGQRVELTDGPELYLFGETAAIGLHARHPDPAAALLAGLDSEQIAAAMESLPDEYRVVATLYFLQDFSYQEIAGILSLPVGTVRSRLHRGRRLLQRALWQIAQECGIVKQLTGEDR